MDRFYLRFCIACTARDDLAFVFKLSSVRSSRPSFLLLCKHKKRNFYIPYIFPRCVATNSFRRSLVQIFHKSSVHAISGDKDEAVVQQGLPWVTRHVHYAFSGERTTTPQPPQLKGSQDCIWGTFVPRSRSANVVISIREMFHAGSRTDGDESQPAYVRAMQEGCWVRICDNI
jgi:hypothetical protein